MSDRDTEAQDSKIPPAFPERSRLGLDERRSILSRIWPTFILLLMAILIELPKLAINDRVYTDNRWLLITVKLALEAVEVFVATAIVFVWYRPIWLRRVYLKTEQKISWVFYCVCTLIVVTFACASLQALLRYCFFEDR